MRYIYFGSSKFSCTILESLLKLNLKPQLVVTQPSKPKKRGLKILPTELYLFAKQNNLETITPVSLKEQNLIFTIKNFKPEFFIVVDYGKIIPKELLELTNWPLGVHPSLLPKYRGAAPINWAIINGESQTGITIFKMNETLDAGPIILQIPVKITEEDDVITLKEKLASIASSALIEAIEKIKANTVTLTFQDEQLATVAPKLKKEDAKIDWNKDAMTIFNLVRGLLDWPTAYTFYNNRLIKILKASVFQFHTTLEPATIVKIDKLGLYVATKKDVLLIKRLKPQDKKEMDAYAFSLGYRVKVNDRFIS